jgi:hypothetical protein
MNDFDFYLNWYYKETERKMALENALNIPIGILSLIIGSDFYLLVHYNFAKSPCFVSALLCLMIGVSFFLSCVATYYLFLSYHGVFKSYTDKGFPIASELRKHKKDLIEYYRLEANNFPDVTGEAEFEEYVITKLTEYIDRNVRNNDKKSETLYLAKGYILRAIVFLVIALLPFMINFFQK